MKNKILDTPIIHNLQNLMTTDEKVLWQGVPNPNSSNSILEGEEGGVTGSRMNAFGVVAFFFLLSIYSFYALSIFTGCFFLFLSLATFFIPEILKNKRKENTKYSITSERIVFQLWWYGKKSIHQIPFSNLRNIIIAEGENKKGVIYFIVKNHQAIDFSTYAFKDSDRRHQPTFEMIENVGYVGQMIKDGISKNIRV